jgi:hypothetical protein
VYGLPIDLEISNDGRWAVLRTTSNPQGSPLPPEVGWVYVWDLQSPGFPMVSGAPDQHDSHQRNTDFVAVLDDRVLSAATSLQPTTAVDVRGYVLWPFGGILHDNQYAGVGDVAIGYAPGTMEHLGAVRHEQGPVTLWNLDTGAAWSLASVDIPLFLTSCAGNSNLISLTGTTLGCPDAIALTANRVVAIANGDQPHVVGNGSNAKRGMVGISRLTAASGWPKSLVLSDCATTPTLYEYVHDVAVMEDGTRGVVSGTGVFGYFSLVTGEMLDTLREADGNELPSPWFVNHVNDYWTVDSIEVTKDRAVMIGNKGQHNQGAPALAWPVNQTPPNYPWGLSDLKEFEITVAQLAQRYIVAYKTLVAAPSLPAGGYTDTNVIPLGVSAPCRAADIAITPNRSRAIVHTRGGTIVIDLTVDLVSGTLLPTVVATTADPLNFRQQVQVNYGTPSQPVWYWKITDTAVLSDSIQCTNEYAVVIGQQAQPLQGLVEIIDLGATTPAIRYTITIGSNYSPMDVVITPDGRRAVVRSLSWATAPGSVGDGRITVIDIANGTVVYDTVLDQAVTMPIGKARGIDQVDCINGFAISAGDNGSDGSSTIQSSGWFQIVKFD